MTTLPTREFSIELTPGSGTWTDLTADVVSINTRRGRNKELGAFETGSGTVVLRNESRKYDPEYAAGAYYGNLRPNRRVRFRGTYSAVTYPRMVGYIDRIRQDYQGPNGAVTTITFSDLFKMLNRVELPSSAYAAEVTNDTPAFRWRLGDPSGSTQATESVTGNYPLGLNGSPTFGTSSLTVRDSDGAVNFATGTAGLQGVFPKGSFPWTTTATYEWLMLGTAGGSGQIMAAVTIGATNRSGIQVQRGVGDILDVYVANNAGTVFNVQSTVAVLDSAVHHVAVTVTAGSPIKVYVDGVDRTSASVNFTGTMANTTDPWITSAGYINYPPFIQAGLPYTADELTLYTTALTGARVAAHNTAARTPWNGDTVVTRAGRILDLAGVAAGDRQLDTGSTSLQSTSLGGTALAYMQKLEETEAGEVFVTRDGKVRLLGRREANQGAYQTTKGTLADATPGAGEVGYRTINYQVDLIDIIDRATVSRDGGVAIQYKDSAAITEFGISDATHSGLLHDSEAYSLQYAQWIVNTHKAPTTRVGTIEIDLANDLVNGVPLLLGVEIGDRVTVKRRPKTGAAISADYRVESISDSTGSGYWNVLLELTPFNQVPGFPVLIWDVGKWDQAVWGL